MPGFGGMSNSMLDILSKFGALPAPTEKKSGKILDNNMQSLIGQVLGAFGVPQMPGFSSQAGPLGGAMQAFNPLGSLGMGMTGLGAPIGAGLSLFSRLLGGK